MKKLRKPFLFVLCLLPAAIIGGYFAGDFSLASLSPEMQESILQQTTPEMLRVAAILQTVLYAVVCGFFGYILSEKLGLMRSFKIEKKPLLLALAAGAFAGAVLSLDPWTFGRWIPEVGASYQGTGSFDAATWISSILYGGVIEEVMMRLFLMSLLAFLGWKLFSRKDAKPSEPVLVVANLLAAILFAAGHLPATAAMFGQLTPLLLARCFLLNGAFGLVFGRLYRKHGIQYAMIAHAMAHVVSRGLWLIFI